MIQRSLLLTGLVACGRPAPPAKPMPACAPRTAAEVVQAIVSMYDALRADDLAAFRARVAPDFYAFEQGKRMDGDTLPKLIADAHAKGRRFEWTVKQPAVRIDCNLATVTWFNEGSIAEGTTTQPRAWVESAALSYEAGSWRIRFFHSTRVPQE